MAKKKEQTTALAVVDSYPALVAGSEAGSVLRENLGGEDIGPGDLDRIKIPAGGGTIWEVPTVEGTDGAKELKGIIIHVSRQRAYWSNPDATGDAPECNSTDMVAGVGNPGGECLSCAFNEFGSRGRGKACKETTLVFILREGRPLPDILSLPATSFKAFKMYRLKLDVPYYAIETSFTLEKATSKDGNDFSRVAVRGDRRLADSEVEGVKSYADELSSLFKQASRPAAAAPAVDPIDNPSPF